MSELWFEWPGARWHVAVGHEIITKGKQATVTTACSRTYHSVWPSPPLAVRLGYPGVDRACRQCAGTPIA